MPDEPVIVQKASDLEYVADGHLFKTPELKTNAELVILLAELESANAELKPGASAKDIDYAQASALRHLVEIAKSSISQEFERAPLHAWESAYSGTPREKIEDIFLFLSEPDKRYQALTELRSLGTAEEVRHWEEITNTVAILMLASSTADEKRLAEMLDQVIAGLDQQAETKPRQPFLQTMLNHYLHEADSTMPTAGQLIAWCVKNGHSDIILDSVGESNDSISQMLLNVHECIADRVRNEEAVSIAKEHGGSFMDIDVEPASKETSHLPNASPRPDIQTAMRATKSAPPETFIG